jgi:hypothetical protein
MVALPSDLTAGRQRRRFCSVAEAALSTTLLLSCRAGGYAEYWERTACLACKLATELTGCSA